MCCPTLKVSDAIIKNKTNKKVKYLNKKLSLNSNTTDM